MLVIQIILNGGWIDITVDGGLIQSEEFPENSNILKVPILGKLISLIIKFLFTHTFSFLVLP